MTHTQTSFTFLNEVLLKLKLDILDCRGQCFDDVVNVSGHISGFQQRMNDIVYCALFLHCTAHTFNLIVQDVMMNVKNAKDFLTMISHL